MGYHHSIYLNITIFHFFPIFEEKFSSRPVNVISELHEGCWATLTTGLGEK